MARLLIVCSSLEGQTRKIAETVAAQARAAGNEATILDAEGPSDVWHFPAADAVLVAAALHMGRHSDALKRFVQEHRQQLGALPSAFLSVSLSAADAATRLEAEEATDIFLMEVDWQPALVAVTGAALRYTRYGLLKRLVMRQIARVRGLPTDASRDWELTDWEQVRALARELLALPSAAQRA